MTKYIIIAVVVVAIAAAGIFYWAQRDNEVTITGSDSSNTTSQESISGTFAEVLALGKNVTCDYENQDESGTTEGTIYIKDRGEGIRSDFVLTKEDGSSINSHLIVDGTMEYIWQDGDPSGVKMEISEEDKDDIFSDDNQEGGLSANEKLTCRTWNVDEEKLTPPTNVTFTDLSLRSSDSTSPVGNENPGAIGNKEELCKTCDSLGGELQETCKVSFNCN